MPYSCKNSNDETNIKRSTSQRNIINKAGRQAGWQDVVFTTLRYLSRCLPNREVANDFRSFLALRCRNKLMLSVLHCLLSRLYFPKMPTVMVCIPYMGPNKRTAAAHSLPSALSSCILINYTIADSTR